MADSKISALTDGGGLQAGDELAIARSATSFRATPIGVPVLVYRYTVAGSDKLSIDTGVDAADAGSNDWTNGDLLEIWIYARTDEVVTESTVNLNLNNDSTSNHYLYGRVRANASSVVQAATSNTTVASQMTGASASSGAFTSTRMEIPNFTGTVGNKSFELVQVYGDATSGNSDYWVFAGTYASTSAITRLAIAPATSGKKLKVGSQLLIYKRLSS